MNGDDGYDRLLEDRIKALEKRVEKVEGKTDNLIIWRSWVLGSVAGIGLMLGAFAKNVADIIKHM